MIKRLFCILLSLMLLSAVPCALAEDAAAETAEVPAEEAAPVLLAAVNGREVKTDDYGYTLVLDDCLNQLQQNGIAEGSEEYDTYYAVFRRYALNNVLQHYFYEDKAAELGIQADAAARAEYEKNAGDYWQSVIDSYIADQGITDESSEEDRSAAVADAEKVLADQYGYTADSFISEAMQYYDYYSLQTPVEAELTKDITVSEEEVQARFNELVDEDKTTFETQYENDVMYLEYAEKYMGQPSYYRPEGYRAVNHILLNVDDELLKNWKDLVARLEEQKSQAESESTEDGGEAPEESPAPDAEPTEEPTPTPEPVTQEMVDEAEKKILDSVQSTVDEIKAKLAAGSSFEDLILEYGKDPGMEDEATRTNGYVLHKDSLGWDSAFQAAAVALEKVGDISDPIVGQYGVHILQYLRDLPAGAVELTQDIHDELAATILSEEQSERMSTLYEEWLSSAGIQYTSEGQEILDAGTAAEAAIREAAEPVGEESAGEESAEEVPAED